MKRYAAVLALVVLARGRGADTGADWLMHNHDPAGWRFNPAESTLGPGNVGLHDE